MSNHTQAKEKLNTGQTRALNLYILNTIRQAERNKLRLEWEWATDNEDFISFLEKEISRNGSITIDEI
jgi:hypothetical protein